MIATTENKLAARIATLEPKLRKLAASMTADQFLADDLFQAAALRIITTCSENDPDGILFLRGKSGMRNMIAANRRYDLTVSSEDDLDSSSADDGEESNDAVWDHFQADQVLPESEVIEREKMAAIHEVIATLTEDNQQVVHMLAVGMSQADIARELNVSRAAVSIRISKIATKLSMKLALA
jgi:RNA polymerase sigma factor (sigma-70 family)